jgi:hypothetical protein
MIKKLREFRTHLSVDGYLNTEHRQNLHALNDLIENYNLTSEQVTQLAENSTANGTDCFFVSRYTLNITNTTTYAPLLENNLIKSGSILGGFYLPKESGLYWVELTGNLQASSGATVTCVPRDNLGNLLDEGLNFGVTGTPNVYGSTSRAFLVNLNASTGIGLQITASASATLNSFSMKITKVG